MAYKLTRRSALQGAGSLTMAAALPGRSARAAGYPDRPVKIIAPFAAGGPSDITARLMSVKLGEAFGQTFVIENRPGAGSNLGTVAVARSAPDGYTLLITSSAFVVNPSLYKQVPYDAFKDFAPVVELDTSPNVFIANPASGITSIKEMIARAKAKPNELSYAHAGLGTTPQLEAEVLKAREGLHGMATVVFAGGGDALKALISGTVQLSSGVLAPAHPQIKAGQIKGLAVTGAKRWPDLPDIPTMAEAGFPDFVFETYCALMAPVKTPPEIVAKLEKVALDVLAKPDFKEKLTQAGFEVTARTGKGHMERVVKEVPMYKKIIEDAKIAKL